MTVIGFLVDVLYLFSHFKERVESKLRRRATTLQKPGPPGKKRDCRRYLIVMGNALDPTLMTAQERLAEIGRILALGLMRLKAQQSSELVAESRDSSLAFPAPKSGRGRRPGSRVGG